MGQFTRKLVVGEPDGDGRTTLEAPLVYILDATATFEVPAGFVTDLASIPGFAQAIISKWDTHAPAAVLHDWLYAAGVTSRMRADRIFRRAMRDKNVAAWKRWAMWAAVRIGGRGAWRGYRTTNKGDSMPNIQWTAHLSKLISAGAASALMVGVWFAWQNYGPSLMPRGPEKPALAAKPTPPVGSNVATKADLAASEKASGERITTVTGIMTDMAKVMVTKADLAAVLADFHKGLPQASASSAPPSPVTETPPTRSKPSSSKTAVPKPPTITAPLPSPTEIADAADALARTKAAEDQAKARAIAEWRRLAWQRSTLDAMSER